jgi:hypothetical protein
MKNVMNHLAELQTSMGVLEFLDPAKVVTKEGISSYVHVMVNASNDTCALMLQLG